MKKNRYLMLLAAFPLLASCSGNSPKEVEQPEIKFASYSTEVSFETFADKAEELEENHAWAKEDFKVPSYKGNGVDYQLSTYEYSKDGKVYDQNKEVSGSEYEGGYDAEHKVVYFTTNESSFENSFDKKSSSSFSDLSVRHTSYQEIRLNMDDNPTTMVASVQEEEREYSTMASTIEKLALRTFASVATGSEAYSLLSEYPGWSESRQAEYKFYLDGNTFTVVHEVEDVYEDKVDDVLVERTVDKYSSIFQVEVGENKLVARYVDKYEYSDEGFTDDSDIGKGMKYYSLEESRGESTVEAGEFEQKPIDISGFQYHEVYH